MTEEEVPRCGCFVITTSDDTASQQFIPLTSVEAQTTIRATASQTHLTQYFLNPDPGKPLDELHYIFPLYDGVSVVSFVCTVADRVIRGIVKERNQAQAIYKQAVESGKVAALLQKSLAASDVFSTSIGNVPAGAQVKVEITYLAELKHDAEVDGIRFTLPTHIAPRYGPGHSFQSSNVVTQGSISIIVDADMPNGCPITSIQSPSHPISVQIGHCSTSAETAEPSPQMASASLALGSARLKKDFILQIVAPKIKEPSAVIETHPTLPNHQAIMTTLVPKFNIPSEKPEIVFVCDRSGSMYYGKKVQNLQNALNIFLRSLPLGVKFNICCFGTKYDFLWPESRAYDQASLKEAVDHVGTFLEGDYGGTEMYKPLEDLFKRRQSGMNLEVFLLTDGDIWDQKVLFELINEHVAKSEGAIRLFTLGIGNDASNALIEGTARAGNGFAQTVGSEEKMDSKVVRMLKGALTPHIYDYSLEVQYERATPDSADNDFVLVEKTLDFLTIEATLPKSKDEPETAEKKIQLNDTSVSDEVDTSVTGENQGDEDGFGELPEVYAPKYLQTPCPVPALFPFNRTTVYVLMSDRSESLVPKSVILKGTSKYGILKQQIPITEVPGRGTMIHQLAAQKQITELEEGRGWIQMAKNAETGQLLKNKFEVIQIATMLNREAVRLCLKYQVAGKYCSLVAVEEGQDDATSTAQHDMPLPAWECKEEEEEESDDDMGFGLFDGYSPPVKASLSLSEDVDDEDEEMLPEATVARFLKAGSSGEEETEDEEMGFCTFDDDTPQAPSVNAAGRAAVASATPQAPPKEVDVLQTIASLQQFTGNWVWDKAALFEGLVGVKKDDAVKKAEEAGLDKEKDAVLATLCALVFLKTKLAEEKDAWEMMAEKAVDWVTEQVGGTEEYERWEKVIRALL